MYSAAGASAPGLAASLGFSAPPIPSGGTLVSSATLAGNLPPAVKPVPTAFGSYGLDGLAGKASQGAPGIDPGMAFGAGASPGPRALVGSEMLSGLASRAALSAGPEAHGRGMLDDAQLGRERRTTRGDVTDKVRAAARPTLVIRRASRPRSPLIALSMVGLVAVAVGAWLALGARKAPAVVEPAAGDRTAPSVTEPAAPSPAVMPSVGVRGETAAGDAETVQVVQPGALAGSAATTEVRAATTEMTTESEPPSAELKQRAEAPAAGRQAAGALEHRDDGAPKKSTRAGAQDGRGKAAKPRPRVEPKRPSKPPSKERTWNDDSPFMPVATPKP
jgi:hypothetical protein